MLDDYLKKIKKQEINEGNKIVITSNSNVEALIEVYEYWLGKKHRMDAKAYLDSALNLIRDIAYTSKDITSLSLLLKNYEQKKYFGFSGAFLSMLINNCEGDNFEVVTKHLSKPLLHLGYYNRKNVTVLGDCNLVGVSMISGKIIVEGKVHSDVGIHSKGGEIYCEEVSRTVAGTVQTYDCNARIYEKGKLVYDGKTEFI